MLLMKSASELKAEAADLLRRTRATQQDARDARHSGHDTLQAARRLRERAAAARKEAQRQSAMRNPAPKSYDKT